MTHAEAREIVRAAWRQVHGREPSEKELAYTQAIALLETGYGRAGQFGALAARGQYNWGALERRRNADGSCPPGTAPGSDQGQVCFFVFPSDVEAAAAFVRNLTKRHWPTISAMTGTPEDVATAMRVSPPYYVGTSGSNEDRIRTYANAIRNSLRSMGSDFSRLSSSIPSSLPRTLLTAAIVAGTAYAITQYTSFGRRAEAKASAFGRRISAKLL